MRVPILPPPGMNSDETIFAAPGLWADGSNVRFWRGKPQIIGGWVKALDDPITGVCRNIRAWVDNSGATNIAFGTHSHLIVSSGGIVADITPTGLGEGSIDGAGSPGYGSGPFGEGEFGESGAATEYFARTWSLANYGQSLMASPRNGGLYQWSNDPDTPAAVVANAPTVISSMIVTPERQVLCFGCNEEVSGDFNPACIRGSGIEDPTDWTTSPSNNVFEHILEGGGRIVAGDMFGSYVAVWTDTSVFMGQFIGDPGQTYRFDQVSTNCGLLAPNAKIVINQTAYWITPDYQFYAWPLGGTPRPIPCPILAEFRDNVVRSQREKVVATGLGQFAEIWFFYPDKRDGIENSRYIAFSTEDGAWFRGELARTAAIDSGPAESPLFVDFAGNAYWHEVGDTADGGPIPWRIETAGMYIGEAEQRGLIRGIWPDFESQKGPINLTILCRSYPQGTVREKGPYALAAGALRKDFLVDTRVAAFRFSGSSSPAFMRMGKPTIDVVVTGQQ